MMRFAIYLLAIIVCGCHQNDAKPGLATAVADIRLSMSRLPDLEKKINRLLDEGSSIKLYDTALEYKKIARSIGADTAWATLFTTVYFALSERSDSTRLNYLYTITAEENLANSDTLFELKYVKALGLLAYENETDFPLYARYLERIVLHPRAMKALGPLYQIWVTQNLGETYTRLDENIAGIHYLQLFYSTCSLIGDEAQRNEASVNACYGLGNTYRNMGEYDSALLYTKKALAFKQVSTLNFAFATAALAEVYHDLENAAMSAETGLKSIALLNRLEEDDQIVYRKAVVYSILADAMLLKKDIIQCISYCDLAIGNFDRLGKKISREKGKVYITRSKAFAYQNKFDSAFSAVDYALKSVIEFSPSTLYSLPQEQELTPENTIYEALDQKASLLTGMWEIKKDPFLLKQALGAYELAFVVERKLMNKFLFTGTTLAQLAESRQRSQKAISLCYQLYQLTKHNQWAEKAFQFAEKNKAFVLLESVKRNLAANGALQKDTLYQNTQKLQLQLAYTERKIAEAATDSIKQEWQQQKNKLDNDLLLANTALGRQSIAYKAVMEKKDSVSAALVSSKLLNEKTGLIEFFNADTVTYAFVLNYKLPIQFIRYGSTLTSEIDSMLYFFRSASAIGNQPIAYQQTAHQLYKTLGFAQLDKGWQNLIVIPDGKLSVLPFDALISNSAFSVNLQQAGYFINQCNTLYGYSASILLKQLGGNMADYKNTTVFAPVFANAENGQQPLLYSQQEAEAIGQNKHTSLFEKGRSTLQNFRLQFANTGILHIASHAYADTGTNSNSKIEFIDSSLLLNELYAMHTNASLVVLSACETGIGHINTSEGPMSLARGFYYAGAKNIITSYWNVDDRSTAALFKSFYSNLGGNSSSDAIYFSKKELIRAEDGKFASPYFWAGFVHVGLPKKEKNQSYWWWLLFILPALGIIAYKIRC
ncbi:MAG: CHAT domain-containing protein [Chitinophagaceae bacterium]|nr:CHAT domain-containing protein [Chitinophagaceae bacterium]